jgi:hypothetical protein
MTSRASPLFAAALACCALGCGSSDDDPDGANCAKVAACGGDVSGKWKLAHACFIVLEEPELGFCEEATATIQVMNASGSFEFDKGSYTRAIDLAATVNLHIPVSCKKQPSGTVTCEDLSGTTSTGDLSCTTESNGDCTCLTPVPPMLTMAKESGTYTVSDNQLETTTGNLEFCAKSSRLTLRPTVKMGMGVMGTAQIQLQTTYDKQ